MDVTHVGKELRETEEILSSQYIGDYAGHNIIFLDVDGVLNCSATKDRVGRYVGIDSKKVKLLKEIAEVMEADIVLSSSWKTDWYKDRKEDQDIFANTLDKKLGEYGLVIVDRTYDSGFARGQGIIDWMNIHGPVNSYIILDDEEFDFARVGISNHWVESNYYSLKGGITKKHVKLIKKNKDKFRTSET